jgi:multiple sugar transport system ATP-binding protein
MTLGTRIVVMKDGVVQQVDTPQNLYNSPANLFTAGFIGSPQMNFLDAKVLPDGSLDLGAAGKVALPAAKAKKLVDGGYAGKTVVMGVRPEHLNDDPEIVAKSSSTLDAKIEVYELLGAEVFLYFTINGANMTARVNPKTDARNGSEVKFAIDVDKVHVFDKETELTITN